MVVSFDRYDFGGLIPYIFFPMLLMALSETPYSMLFKRLLIALPFCFFAGVTNVIFDREVFFTIGNIPITSGVISLFTILLKAYLCVMAVLILVSVTPFSELTGSMRKLRVPDIFVTIFEMTYRYIGVLFEEAYSMYVAYSLRSSKKGIEVRDMGSFIGQLLIRSFDRADRVYNAMKCRGYDLHVLSQNRKKLMPKDIVFTTAISLLCIAFRFFNMNQLFARIFGGV
jgi:cobalt/nickel transport system permease protein